MMVKNSIDLLRGEDGGGLVEHDVAGLAVEHLDDLDPLLHADGEILDDRIGVDVEAAHLGGLPDRRHARRPGR